VHTKPGAVKPNVASDGAAGERQDFTAIENQMPIPAKVRPAGLNKERYIGLLAGDTPLP